MSCRDVNEKKKGRRKDGEFNGLEELVGLDSFGALELKRGPAPAQLDKRLHKRVVPSPIQ